MHKNGKDSEKGLYINGKKNGEWNKWYENGILASNGKYEDGMKEGLWKFWYNDGSKEKEINFLNDKENGQMKVWYSNGKQKNNISYSIGIKMESTLSGTKMGKNISEGVYKSGEKWSGYFGDDHYINGVKGHCSLNFLKMGTKRRGYFN